MRRPLERPASLAEVVGKPGLNLDAPVVDIVGNHASDFGRIGRRRLVLDIEHVRHPDVAGHAFGQIVDLGEGTHHQRLAARRSYVGGGVIGHQVAGLGASVLAQNGQADVMVEIA